MPIDPKRFDDHIAADEAGMARIEAHLSAIGATLARIDGALSKQRGGFFAGVAFALVALGAGLMAGFAWLTGK